MTFVMFSYADEKGSNLFSKNHSLLLVICLLSRALSSIYYVEDVDSLRFALSLKDYDLASFQPHFPGYFVFSMAGKLFYLLTHSLAISFSLTGGLAVFMVIISFQQIYRHFFPTDKTGNTLLIAFIFFNPLLWILSNRYMADMLGVGFLALTSLFFLKAFVEKNQKILIAYYISLGLLAGSRLSYLPFFLPATLYLLWQFRKNFILQIVSGLAGLAIWLVPMIIDTGWSELVRIAQSSTSGHFNEWGGTIRTDTLYGLRFVRMFQYTWADGLGGYWPGRNLLTVLSSLLFVIGITFFIKNTRSISFKKEDRLALLFLLCLLSYSIWAFLYQNVLYKSRHLMPFVPFLLFSISRGVSIFIHRWKITGWGFLGAGMAAYLLTTAILVMQHRKPTAIAQVKNLLERKYTPNTYVVADPLIEFYINRQLKSKVTFLPPEVSAQKLDDILNKGGTIYTFEAPDQLKGKTYRTIYSFYHNPYVNRMWSEITFYEY